jgi:hypothetical protein
LQARRRPNRAEFPVVLVENVPDPTLTEPTDAVVRVRFG